MDAFAVPVGDDLAPSPVGTQSFEFDKIMSRSFQHDSLMSRKAYPAAGFMRPILIACLGLLLFLSPIKFGNPIESLSGELIPSGVEEWFWAGWMPVVGWIAIFFLSACAFGCSSLRFHLSQRPWTFWMPLAWLITQWLAVPFSIYRQASLDTVALFSAAVLVYYLSALAVRDERDLRALLTCLLGALIIVCAVGFEQKSGGLAQTEKWALQYHPELLTPDLLRKLHDPRGTRIFSTFVYPPSLAGFLALAFGPSLAALWLWRGKFTRIVFWVLVGLLTIAVVLCLVWSRSKGGLLALGLGALASLLFLPLSYKQCITRGLFVVGAVVLVFLIGYGIQDVRFALSTGSQRSFYWLASVKVFADHPWFGTGPGSFGSIHALYKFPAAEYARLAHNNFLQMASDSGLLGFLTFAALWTVGLAFVLRRLSAKVGWVLTMGVGGGLLAWMWHNAMDFDLYIPGLAFPAFILLGAIEGFTTPHHELESRRPNWLVRAGRLFLALICLVAIWPMTNRLRAACKFSRAQEYLETKPPNLYAAMGAMERATKLVPGDVMFWDFLGRLQSDVGQPDAAIESTRHAVQLDRYRASYHWHLGWLFGRADNGLSDRARREFDEAKHLYPSNPDYSKYPTTFF